MRLRTTNQAAQYDFISRSMQFYMINENDRPVRCSISDRGLQRLDRHAELGESEKRRVFSEHRGTIEVLAIQKFDVGLIDGDGWVRLSEEDIPSDLPSPAE